MGSCPHLDHLPGQNPMEDLGMSDEEERMEAEGEIEIKGEMEVEGEERMKDKE